MIAGRKFILDLLFIKCSVLRWEINTRQGVGWVGEGTEPGPCQAGSCSVWVALEAFWGQRVRVPGVPWGTVRRVQAQEASWPAQAELSPPKLSQQ